MEGGGGSSAVLCLAEKFDGPPLHSISFLGRIRPRRAGTWHPAGMSNSIRRPDVEDGDSGTSVVTKTRPKTKRPSLYRVLLLNDDYTPMEFVVLVLERFFQKAHEEATRIMLHVHQHGVGECGVYTFEVAESKVTQVMDFARKHQHPLQCVMEKK
jgi:ATP-dependent Clp protease adaptor protein ClpS